MIINKFFIHSPVDGYLGKSRYNLLWIKSQKPWTTGITLNADFIPLEYIQENKTAKLTPTSEESPCCSFLVLCTGLHFQY